MNDKSGSMFGSLMRRFSEPITFGGEGKGTSKADAGRREARRVPVPVGLFVHVPPDQFVRLELSISMEASGGNVHCFLYDVNDSGAGIVCPQELEVGERVHILGEIAGADSPQLDVLATIVNRRDFPGERSRPKDFEGETLCIHGLSLDPEDARVLLNATLECVDIVRKTAGEAAEQPAGEAAAEPVSEETPPKPAPGPANFDLGESFGFLPLAEVEITEEEVRRRSVRDDLVVPLRIVLEEGAEPRDISLRVRKLEQEAVANPAELLNYSPEGARLLTNARLKVGELVLVSGVCPTSEEVLFEIGFAVRNMTETNRLRGPIAKRAEKMGGVVSAFGMEIEAGAENKLFKAALDSIYLATREGSG